MEVFLNINFKNKYLVLVSSILFLIPISSLFAQTTNKTRYGKFLVSGQVENGFEIFEINDDGTGQTQLTHTSGQAFDPKWSPSGKSFAYRLKDCLKIMKIEGQEIGAVTLKDVAIKSFDWLPDETGLIFSGSDKPGSEKIYSVKFNSNEIKCIAGCSNMDFIWRDDIAVSPDGLKVAFTEASDSMSDQAVIIKVSTGEEITRSKFSNDGKDFPSNRGDGYLEALLANLNWTPDSKKIYFERWGQDTQNYFLNIPSGLMYKWGKIGDEQLSWSSEYNMAVFSPNFHPEINISTSDAKNRRQITPDGNWCGYPMIITQGNRVAYLSNRGMPSGHEGSSSLFVINRDGTNPTRITDLILDHGKSQYSWNLFEK
jgi:Tol biopolymer transport system component